MTEEERLRGRGATINPPNRFDRLHYEVDDDCFDRDDDRPTLKTEFFRDPARTIIAHNDSPDVGFSTSINPYRGCEHGCIYCFARPAHEYLGLSAGTDFESRIFVKEDAPELLRKELSAKSWTPQTIAISGVTDCYQPIEKKLQLTRRCLEVLAEFRNPIVMITKNHLVTRDVDILSEMAKLNLVKVFLSVTTLDSQLARTMEPRTSSPQLRIDAIRTLAESGVPTGAMVAPVIPAITDHEIPSILEAVSSAGAHGAGYVLLRLPFGVGPLFEHWLEQNFPDRKEKVLNRMRGLRNGKLYESRWGLRMRGEGAFAEQIEAMFSVAVKKYHLNERDHDLTTEHFRKPAAPQLSLF